MSCPNPEGQHREAETTVGPALSELDFDPVALKAKYLAERDKRIRNEGNQQYTDMVGEFSRYIDDPATHGPVKAGTVATVATP